RLVSEKGPAGLDVAAGEYAYVLADFRNLLDANAVDCLQADVTRCGGITGLLQAGGLAASFGIDLSAHCAPQLSAHAFCAVPNLRHLEYFHDHVRVESLLFDGIIEPEIDPDRRLARVEPGLILDHLRKKAEHDHQLTFGPDPSTHEYCTFGGMIASNSCGVRSVMAQFYGPGPRTSDNVHELDVVLYDG